MRKFSLSMVVLATALSLGMFAKDAQAQYTVTGGTSGYETVSRGVVDIGMENILLVRYISDAEGSTLDAAYLGGLLVRYFLLDNLSLGLSLNFLYQTNHYSAEASDGSTVEDDVEDLGFVGFVMLNYFLRLGNSLFFKPGIGLGGLYGRRDVPTPGEAEGAYTRMSLYGGAGRVDLGFIFFASSHFSLRAGLDVIFRLGAAQPAGAESETFFSVDAGFNIGLGYTF